jgi:hypothetical protein
MLILYSTSQHTNTGAEFSSVLQKCIPKIFMPIFFPFATTKVDEKVPIFVCPYISSEAAYPLASRFFHQLQWVDRIGNNN